MKLYVAVEDIAVEDVAEDTVSASGTGVGFEFANRIGALGGSTRFGSIVRSMAGSAMAAVLCGAGPALALDGIDLTEPAEAAAEGECPRLIQIKYPFLSCKNGEIGLADGNATWENSRQIPRQSDFMEGNGYWGDELNRE
jgi:hypothetical protein